MARLPSVPSPAAFASVLSMNSFEPLFWMGSAYVAMLLARRPRPVLWLALGALVGIGFHQAGVGQPGFHALDAALQGAAIAIAFGDHPLEHHHVGVQILDDRILVQLDGATGCGTLGAGIGQFEGLFHLEFRQSLDLQDAAGDRITSYNVCYTKLLRQLKDLETAS